eukprot:TRINITY_DN20043_c0_g1_i1.p1 TRINITY_DN20043_c0_g1~~TRINITY_DN20043_c0_g1_i1.p1  ORF type:complete len:239 (-),score=44.82 TRINITY_DN20043_c0_g1_i1:128-844(-)
MVWGSNVAFVCRVGGVIGLCFFFFFFFKQKTAYEMQRGLVGSEMCIRDRNILKAYTLQTKPAFYKMLNDAFRSGNPEKIEKYRSFYIMLHDLVKKNILLQHVGSVFRGTYFNKTLMESIRPGAKFISTCFTSTSKSEKVAYEFAMKTKRNVLLEIELNRFAFSNVDIHNEAVSAYPEEQEVLLLPFCHFEVKGIYSDGRLFYVTLVENIPDFMPATIKGVEYLNQSNQRILFLSLIHI